MKNGEWRIKNEGTGDAPAGAMNGELRMENWGTGVCLRAQLRMEN